MKKVGSMFSRMLWFLAAVLVVYQAVSYVTFYNYLLAPTVKQISHLLANQVKLIFPVNTEQLALSEDAEALVYVTTGTDIYTQSEAVQHGFNDAKPYPYLEENISRELGGPAKVRVSRRTSREPSSPSASGKWPLATATAPASSSSSGRTSCRAKRQAANRVITSSTLR